MLGQATEDQRGGADAGLQPGRVEVVGLPVVCSGLSVTAPIVAGGGTVTVSQAIGGLALAFGSHAAFVGAGAHRWRDHAASGEACKSSCIIAYPALLRRFPDLRLAMPTEQIPFREVSIVHGIDALTVTW
jgi:hypothetical protein